MIDECEYDAETGELYVLYLGKKYIHRNVPKEVGKKFKWQTMNKIDIVKFYQREVEDKYPSTVSD